MLGFQHSANLQLAVNTEERLAEDDLRVFDALKLVSPVAAGHSVAGNELSRLGIHHYDRVGGLMYLDALNDAGDDWTDYDALSANCRNRRANHPRLHVPT